jgi:plasmid maintenance system killer protein
LPGGLRRSASCAAAATIRSDRWRLCFVWQNGDAYDVEIVDYH